MEPTTHPPRPQKPYEALFNYALSLREHGDLHGAIAELESLDADHPDEWPIQFMLGTVHFEADHYAQAAPYFVKAVALRPTHRLTSLGLFHSLWDLGQEEQAIKEMHRFLQFGECEDYREILRDLKRNGLE